MKKLLLPIIALIFFHSKNSIAQCHGTETLNICDITVIDGNGDLTPDGIINLYDEFNALSGLSLSTANGNWFDPGYNFALDESNGELHIWDLKYASTAIDDYQFTLIDQSSGCTDNIIARINVVIAPYAGTPVLPSGGNTFNMTACDAFSIDLFNAYEPQPSPHLGGKWEYLGSVEGSTVSIDEETVVSEFDKPTVSISVPYEPGIPIEDDDLLDFSYTIEVPDVTGCGITSITSNIKIKAVRAIQAGYYPSILTDPPSTNIPPHFLGIRDHHDICETDLLPSVSLYDNDIDLRDDLYLIGEDIEGTWSSDPLNDPTGQISNPGDNLVNLKEAYNHLYNTNPRFGRHLFEYTHTVSSRSPLGGCDVDFINLYFLIFEYVRPFHQEEPLNLCLGDDLPDTVDLYDEITFTTENGTLYDYNDSDCHWEYWSGNDSNLSNLGITGFNQVNVNDPSFLDGPSSGTINLSQLTNEDAGTYTFRFTAFPYIGCTPADYHTNPCSFEYTDVTVIIHRKLYAGEDTLNLELCEANYPQGRITLTSLLETNGIDGAVYIGPEGIWTDTNSGDVINNEFILPTITNQQDFNFLYTTTNTNGCIEEAVLNFTIYESNLAGQGSTIQVCNTENEFNLFERLSENPSTGGTWIGPEGFTSDSEIAIFDPATSIPGEYIYSSAPNISNIDPTLIVCPSQQSIINVVVNEIPNPGINTSTIFCKNQEPIDLFSLLSPDAEIGGTFSDPNNTGALNIDTLDPKILNAGSYTFIYTLDNNTSCKNATSEITIIIEDVEQPISENQTFCASLAKTIEDLNVSTPFDYKWYATAESTDILPNETVLKNNTSYYATAVNDNNCESERIKVDITILPLNDTNCNPIIPDGISPNGDGVNDELDFGGLVDVFPKFDLKILNRYGTLVFEGNQNTSLFEGKSNVRLTIGDELPTGVYFYIFNPNDGETAPIQGNFYLAR